MSDESEKRQVAHCNFYFCFIFFLWERISSSAPNIFIGGEDANRYICLGNPPIHNIFMWKMRESISHGRDTISYDVISIRHTRSMWIWWSCSAAAKSMRSLTWDYKQERLVLVYFPENNTISQPSSTQFWSSLEILRLYSLMYDIFRVIVYAPG